MPYIPISLSLKHIVTITHTPAGSDGVVEPGGALPVIRPVDPWDLRDIEHRQAVVNVAFHIHLTVRLVGVHVHQPRHHIRGEGHDERLESRDCVHKECNEGKLVIKLDR